MFCHSRIIFPVNISFSRMSRIKFWNFYNEFHVRREFSKNASNGIKYTKDHEWLTLGDANTGTVGISKHAEKTLGTIVYVEILEPNSEVKKGARIGMIESSKAANEIYSPVSGIILETNKLVVEKPRLINSDPMKEGWLLRLSMKDTSELQQLMDEEQYKRYIEDSS